MQYCAISKYGKISAKKFVYISGFTLKNDNDPIKLN